MKTDLEAAVQAAMMAGDMQLACDLVQDAVYGTASDAVTIARATVDRAARDRQIVDALQAVFIAHQHTLAIRLADLVDYRGCLWCLWRDRKGPVRPAPAVQMPWGTTYACETCRAHHLDMEAVHDESVHGFGHAKNCWLCTAANTRAERWAANV